MLSDEQTVKFQSLYLARYGKEISVEEAREQGERLIRLLELVYKPTEKRNSELVTLSTNITKP